MFKRAFSLMELMLVVVIIGIIYALALSTFKPPENKELESFTLLTLPTYLRNNFALQDAKIVCMEPCGSCRVLVDGEWTEEEIELFTTTDVESFELDNYGFTREKEYAPHDIEDGHKRACFVLHKRANDSISPVILKNGETFIYYKAGYEPVEAYASINEIENAYQQIANIIRNEH